MSLSRTNTGGHAAGATLDEYSGVVEQANKVFIAGTLDDVEKQKSYSPSLEQPESPSLSQDAAGERSQIITKNGKDFLVTWTLDEERRAVRKADILLLPVLSLLFVMMALDRTNISSVLTSTFLTDTGMTRDQANTGTSLLWLGIVLLEIPANIVLHRVGPHYWIPCQVLVWGTVECLQSLVTGPSGWYAARIFLGLAESGFIPGGLYTLSRWYTQDEIAKRTAIFFFGPSISASFGSLIGAGCLNIDGKGGLYGWQWIFIVCGVMTISLLALLVIAESPHHTGRLYGGRGWLTEREADVYVARILLADPRKGEKSTMKITGHDISSVLLSWRVWPYLIMCLSGLQSVGGLTTWGAVIIKSLGFTSIRANLLNAPAPIVASILGVCLAAWVDKYKRYGYAITFSAIWTLACLIALYHLPVTSKSSWSFYAAYFLTTAAPSWQNLNVTWLSLNMRTPQQRAVAYAVYSQSLCWIRMSISAHTVSTVGCSNLGGTYGNQVFRANDAPLYRRAWAACIALGAVWLATTVFQTVQFILSNRAFDKKIRNNSELEESDGDVLLRSKDGRRVRFWY